MEKNELYSTYIEETYEELTQLGDGETGKTFLAKHRGSGKIVVKKIVSLQAGKAYEKIRGNYHPNLARVYEVCYGKEYCTVIEEYISGETLENVLEELKILPVENVYNYFTQILHGVYEIHKLGIVHRDLTPTNILISTDGIIKLIDFGIARIPKENQKKDTAILGTVGYASPEQYGFLQTDNRTDIYAIGILLNKMLTGKLPNEQLTANEQFQKIVEKCIQIDPEKRYKSVEEILNEIEIKERCNLNNSETPWKADLSIVPGFRTGKTWHKIVAIMGYVMMAIYSIGSLVECAKGVQPFLLELCALVIYIGGTFFIVTNFARWDYRWKPFGKMKRETTVTIRIIAGFFTFYCGILIENYVRYTMLGMPRPN